MQPLPAANLRANLATWAVPTARLPAVAVTLRRALPAEPFDPAFLGQELTTTYFDTADFALRKARVKGDRYLTLRLRCYRPDGEGPGEEQETYALSAKTEDQKWRQEVPAVRAALLLAGPPGARDAALRGLLPADLLARLLQLAGDAPLVGVVAVCCRRYAVEDDSDRLTLDVDVRTDTCSFLPFSVLEYKSTHRDSAVPAGALSLSLRPIKLSKFLWATGV
jgi:hypothetical protein